jgi:hypothetical protein
MKKISMMDKTIKLRLKKEMDNGNELKVLKLKGSLISRDILKLYT